MLLERFHKCKKICKIQFFEILKLKVLMSFLSIFLIIFAFFGLGFVLINIRHILTGQEFRGTCANNNPMLKDQIGECTVCGRKTGEACKMPEVEEVK